MKSDNDRSAVHADGEQVRERSRQTKREDLLGRAMIKQQKLVAHLLAAQEEERTAVAQEIQEELGQMLATLQLNVSSLMTGFHDHTQLAARAAVMEELVASSIETVQRISSELRPVMLDLLGLTEALEWKVQKFRRLTGISCKTFIILAEKRVDREVSTAIFRIVQEALNNVARHSGATSVEINLVERKGWLMLTVRDNGRGIVENEKKNLLSFGIAEIQERAGALGGKLRIFGSPQHGTALFARIPIAREGGSTCQSGL